MKPSTLASSVLTILTFTMLVSGCGGAGKTSASLDVVNGFLVSANGYDGGLIIHGRSDKGDTFSFALTNSVSSTIELPNGTWTFRAVGWNGYSDLTYKFGGTPYCGSTTASLSGGSASVSLTLNQSACDNDAFASTPFRNAGTLRDLTTVLALKTLLKYPVLPTDSVSSKKFTSATSDSAIITSIPDDLQSDAKGIQFFALKKDLAGNWAPAFPSKCLGGGSNGQFVKAANSYAATDFKLPTLMPMGIAIFKDTSCTEKITSYHFPEGLEKPAAEGDHLFHLDPSTNSRLIVVSGEHRRGYSSFMALLPTIQCGATGAPTRCKTMPTSGVPDFVLFLGSVGENVFIPDVSSCASISNSANITVSCTPTTDGVQLAVDTTSGALNTSSSETITAGGNTYTIAFQNSGVAAEREKKSIFNDLLSFIGPDNFSLFRRTFIDGHDNNHDDDARKAWGLIGKVREHLSPAGALSLFGLPLPAGNFRDNCAAVSGYRDISFTEDDGTVKSYRVSASAPTLTPDTYTCNSSNSDASSCSMAFEKKIQVFNLNKSASVPEMTFTLDCDGPVGKFSSSEENTESSSNRKHKERMIISWNTDTGSNHANQRYEFVRMSEGWEYDGTTWVKTDDQRSIGRVFKTEQERAQLVVFAYDTHTDVSQISRNSSLEARQASLDVAANAACVSNLSQASSNTDPLDLFVNYASFRTGAVLQNVVYATNQLGFSSTFSTSSYGAATTVCNSLTSNKLIGLTTSANNNHLINKTLPQSVDSLASIDSSVFGSNAFLNH